MNNKKNITYDDLINQVASYDINALSEVKKAYNLASNLHKGQYRQSGEEYIIHPLNVAYTLANMQADQDTLCASLLHDVVEDTNITLKEIEELFNPTVALLVDGVTKISKMNFDNKIERNNANIRKIISSINIDARIVIIKLADRLHNMQTLQHKSPNKQIENARETLNLFAPIAENIGAYKIKNELEDLSFMYLKEKEYNRIKEKRNEIIINSKDALNEMSSNIKEKSSQLGIDTNTKNIVKNIYGIYKRELKGLRIDEIHNLLSIIINTQDIKDCYILLGIIHSLYNPLNDKLKDYICRPKTNMYSSLHTTLFGLEDRLVQAQIRTHDMDKIANNGITAYWALNKDKSKNIIQDKLKENTQFLNSLVDIMNTFIDNKEFIDHINKEIFTEKVYVYTNKGEYIELPLGSTIIDYIFKLDPNLAYTMIGATVNGLYVDIDYILNNEDRVNIITNDIIKNPNYRWEKYAKTAYAKRKIRELRR